MHIETEFDEESGENHEAAAEINSPESDMRIFRDTFNKISTLVNTVSYDNEARLMEFTHELGRQKAKQTTDTGRSRRRNSVANTDTRASFQAAIDLMSSEDKISNDELVNVLTDLVKNEFESSTFSTSGVDEEEVQVLLFAVIYA